MSLLRYWIWLSTIPGLSLRGQLRLLDSFYSPEAIYLADRRALEDSGALTKNEIALIERRDFSLADKVLEECRRKGIRILTMQDAAYPRRLMSIDMPPPVLYYKGNLPAFDNLPSVAVVGSRNASGYGLLTAKRMGMQLGACGGTVISGAAKGIDTMALEGALSTDSPVIAVLGNGLDVVYPRSAERLYKDVERNGCLLSEFIPGTKPLGGNFPRRNRIMSGLALGVLVVEAAKKSGSLITAEYALEQGRDVFAVPGNIGLACCEGSNELIRDGAYLVTCGWDVLQLYKAQFPEQLHRWNGGDRLTLSPHDRAYIEDDMEPEQSGTKDPPGEAPGEKRIDNAEKSHYIDLEQIMDSLTQDEQVLMRILQGGRLHVDDLIARSGMPAARVLSSLTLLEIKGYVQQHPGKRFGLILLPDKNL